MPIPSQGVIFLSMAREELGYAEGYKYLWNNK
jgi:hypothetical protein